MFHTQMAIGAFLSVLWRMAFALIATATANKAMKNWVSTGLPTLRASGKTPAMLISTLSNSPASRFDLVGGNPATLHGF